TGWYGERIKTVILENIENRGAGWQEQLATLERALVITTVIVPEPSTYAAGATALLTGLLLLRNRRKRRMKDEG
ncbi:MAG: PEP-CTERM sorting domain-containing protein, partial [Puniceicoccales bacterium]|nr:PEP-CTERM sorting domain-containing protein [Puniceicoccales bacterium]